MNNLEKISEKEFHKIIFDSVKSINKTVLEYETVINSLTDVQVETLYFKRLGYNIEYFFNEKTKEITYEINDRKVGFK